MELTQLVLHNYKNHRRRTLNFRPGVTGIVGDNGAGKSSVISAISFLFTGEVDTTTKQQSITLGTTEGWVKGTFILNGKEGTLERHLGSSKIILTYDGDNYNKTSEVNALWIEMLKIDSAIFNNVIIAKQGEIQKLFSDETTVREKIFQKIFMVPPTEKLRAMIWDGYVKGCPPEKPSEDVVGLQTTQAQVAHQRNLILASIDFKLAQIPDTTLIKCVSERIEFLNKCRTDTIKRPQIEEKINQLRTELLAIDNKIEEATKLIEGIDEVELRNGYESLLLNKKDAVRKKSLHTEWFNLSSKVIGEQGLADQKERAAELKLESDELQRLNIEGSASLREVSAKVHRFSQLHGHANCPTCNQVLPDIVAFLDELRRQEVNLKTINDGNNKRAGVIGKQLQALNTQIASGEAIYNRTAYLEAEMKEIGDVEYSEETFNQISQGLKEYDIAKNDLAALKISKMTTDSDIKLLEEKLNSLSIYDGDGNIAEELTVMEAATQEHKQLCAEIANLQIDAAKLEHELRLCDERIRISQVNSEYNTRRRNYINKLTRAHELLHVSKFPRKLIETYMDQVQTSLAGYLEHFDLPYTVKINDGFKIALVNDEGLELPTVSGGQEVMVGICLRLALHKMFAKSFPIWIIDEGTTHLSETKKPMYFDLIDGLRTQKIINQIIVIDHDDRLASVVDQTIQL